MLSGSPHIEVVGMANNGEDALQLVETVKPDVVTCDLVMPILDGVGFVRKQMSRRAVPILILAASAQDTEQVLEALEAGAVDFIQKPTALANNDLLKVREELVQKVRAAASVASPPVIAKPTPGAPKKVCRKTHARFDIVVLGISTGGPQALRYLVPQFPADFPVPLAIVLHMPVGYTALFAEKLAEISCLPVKEAFEDCLVNPGEVLIASAGRHLKFKKDNVGSVRVHLSMEPMEKAHRPSVDVLFESAAEHYGKRALGVVMTGMGDDGALGAGLIKAKGGTILTQDKESCVIYGMPRTVVEAGLSDAAVPLSCMAEEIIKRL